MTGIAQELRAIAAVYDPERYTTFRVAESLGASDDWVTHTVAARGPLVAAVEQVAFTLGNLDASGFATALRVIVHLWRARAGQSTDANTAMRLGQAAEQLALRASAVDDYEPLEVMVSLLLSDFQLTNLALDLEEGNPVDIEAAQFLWLLRAECLSDGWLGDLLQQEGLSLDDLLLSPRRAQTVGEVWQEWIDAEGTTKARRDAIGLVRKHVVEPLIGVPARDLTLDQLADALRRGYSALGTAHSRYKLTSMLEAFKPRLTNAGSEIDWDALPWLRDNPRVRVESEIDLIRGADLPRLNDFLGEAEVLWCELAYWLALTGPSQQGGLTVADLIRDGVARRYVSQSGATEVALPGYLLERLVENCRGRMPDAPLVVGPRGGRVHYSNLRYRLKTQVFPALGKRPSAGFGAFRDGRAVDLLTSGHDADEVARLLDVQIAYVKDRYGPWL